MERLNGKDFLIKDLKQKIRDLEMKNGQLVEQLERVTKERDTAQYCLDETRKSFSYRLGYKLTALPRALRSKGE